MAFVNVTEWKAEQVAEWLQGLDKVMQPYAHHFINNNVTGQSLLNLTVDDLTKLRVEKLGHQEIILEALESLKNLHFNLDTENLQYVCLRLSCRARSLSNEIRIYGPNKDDVKQTVSKQTMWSTADVLDSIFAALAWLDRKPFAGQPHFETYKGALIQIGSMMAMNAMRNRFAETPVNAIRECCDKIADLSEYVVREVHDVLVLQPAFLEIATVKRRADEDDFGIVLETQFGSGSHLVKGIRFGSAGSRTSGKIEIGDEIVQVNYQTVIGWQLHRVQELMLCNSSELILTLKKRPRHSQGTGQIYIKPFRIPARQKNPVTIFNNLPSPRAELLVAPSIAFPNKPKANPLASSYGGATATKSQESPIRNFTPSMNSTVSGASLGSHSSSEELQDLSEDEHSSDDSDEAFLSSCMSSRSKSPTQSIRSVLSRPRSAPQRRNTISGTSPSQFKDYINIAEIWNQRENSSKTSTLHSKDSGLSTLGSMQKDEADTSSDDPQIRVRPKAGARPHTMAPAVNFTQVDKDKDEHPFYMNLPDQSKAKLTAKAKEAISAATAANNAARGSLMEKEPALVLADTPAKKRPIPQPRSISRNNSNVSAGQLSSADTSVTDSSAPSTPKESLTKSLRSLLPDSVTKSSVIPVPTRQFKSFKKAVPPPPKVMDKKKLDPSLPPEVPDRRSKPITPAKRPPRVSSESLPLPTSAPPPRPAKASSVMMRQHNSSATSLSSDHRHGMMVDLPPRLPERSPVASGLKSAQSYHPMPPTMGKNEELKFAFDMNLSQTTEDEPEHDYFHLSDASSLAESLDNSEADPKTKSGSAPEPPPMFVPSTYRFKSSKSSKDE